MDISKEQYFSNGGGGPRWDAKCWMCTRCHFESYRVTQKVEYHIDATI